MKAILSILIITIILSFTGCGRNTSDQNSNPTDSVNKITTSSESADEGINLFANSSNCYFNIPDGVELQGVIQQDIAGTKECQVIEIPDCSTLCAVTDSELYYIKYEDNDREDDHGTLCRIPIQKTDNGDKLLIEQSEIIFQPEGFIQDGIYIADQYIIYTTYNKLYKFSLSEKTSQLLYEWKDVEKYNGDGDDYFTLMTDCNDYRLIRKNGLLFLAMNTGIFTLDPDSGELHQIHTEEYSEDHSQGAFNGNLYINCCEEVYFYDGTADQAICLLDTDAIYQSVDAVNPWSDSDTETDRHCKIIGIYPDGDKIYYCIEADWKQTVKADQGLNKGKMVEQWYCRTLLFSTGNGKDTTLQYEKDFSEYWHRTTKHRNSYPDEEEIGALYESLEQGHIHGIRNHTVTFCPIGDSSDTMMEYDLQTGKTRQLSDREVERWKCQMDGTPYGQWRNYSQWDCLLEFDEWEQRLGISEEE